MSAPPLEARDPDYEIRVPFAAPPQRAWRLVGDTHAANIAAGLDAYVYSDEPQSDGTTRRTFTTTANNLALAGEEAFSRWEYPHRFAIRRQYSKGPFVRSLHRVLLEPTATGCDVVHQFWMAPRGALGKVWKWGFGRDVLPMYVQWTEQQAKKAEEAEEDALPELSSLELEPLEPYKARPAQVQRVQQLVQRARGLYDSPVVDRIADLLLTLPDDDVARLQPLVLAAGWGTERQETLDAFLASTSAGLTNLRWDVICPHCRGDKQNLTSLTEAKGQAFCSACNLDFDVDLTRSLEAVFVPHPQVRMVDHAPYCLGGPGTTPHILYQSMLEPGEEWTVPLQLEAGRYRVRVTGVQETRWLVAGEESALEPLLIGDDALRGPDPTPRAGEATPWAVRNVSRRRALVVIESVAWSDFSLPAAELVASQRFRDLFSEDMLTAGVSLSVEAVTILFTDLVGSTAMYGAIGDARAFGLVWTHFEILEEIVRDTGGATVKTIGDAIMAAFTRPEDALRAASELHERVADYCAEAGHEYPVALKIGLHEGPCIVVTLNERLDYFGQTVNTAARVQGLSDGGDILVTPYVAERTDDCTPLRELGWVSEEVLTTLKGLDGEQRLLRFERSDVARTEHGVGTIDDDGELPGMDALDD